MKTKVIHIAAAIALFALSANAGAARRRAAIAPVKDDLTITFTRSLVDAGSIAGRSSHEVGVRIDSRSAVNRRAVLRASLPRPDGQFTVKIDGIPLGPLPVVIDARAPLGVTTTHRIEIEVPPTAPEGALMTAISWEAETP